MISKTFYILFSAAASLLVTVSAFSNPIHPTRTSTATTSLNAYVPDGLTADQYKRIKASDEAKKGKNLGALGPRGFKSRSMQAWQQAYDKGQAAHNFAPIGYKEKLKSGELRKSDVPYMVRGGSWDNSDVSGVKKLPWLKADKDYARGGYKKEQSVSILGSGPGLDWAGVRPRDYNLGNNRVPGFS
jgi:hypothetical protein